MNVSRLYPALAVASSVLIFSASAAAQQAVTNKAVNVRAGPDRGYPLVAWVPAGSLVYVNGCLEDYRWCDVTAGNERGWVYAKNIDYTYQGQPRAIYGNGQNFALPILSFIIGSYWNDNYRDRSWYRTQPQWNNWRPGNRPPPGYRPDPRPPQPIVRPNPRPPHDYTPGSRPPNVRPPEVRPPIVRPQPQPQRPPNVNPPPRPQPTPQPRPTPPPRNNGGSNLPGTQPGNGPGNQ